MSKAKPRFPNCILEAKEVIEYTEQNGVGGGETVQDASGKDHLSVLKQWSGYEV